MTRGEYIYQRRKYFLDLIEKSKIKFDDVGKINYCKSVPKRLPYKIAIYYYTQKLKKSLARAWVYQEQGATINQSVVNLQK